MRLLAPVRGPILVLLVLSKLFTLRMLERATLLLRRHGREVKCTQITLEIHMLVVELLLLYETRRLLLIANTFVKRGVGSSRFYFKPIIFA